MYYFVDNGWFVCAVGVSRLLYNNLFTGKSWFLPEAGKTGWNNQGN